MACSNVLKENKDNEMLQYNNMEDFDCSDEFAGSDDNNIYLISFSKYIVPV